MPRWGTENEKKTKGMSSGKKKTAILRRKEKNPGCLVYIGDEILPSYVGIIS